MRLEEICNYLRSAEKSFSIKLFNNFFNKIPHFVFAQVGNVRRVVHVIAPPRMGIAYVNSPVLVLSRCQTVSNAC